MADQKLSALTELAATPASNDEIYIRDVSEAAAAESKRILISNLIASLIAKGLLTTKGDVIAASGASTPVRVAVGANDEVLTADSAQASGVKWAAAGGAADYPMKLKPNLTRYVLPGWYFYARITQSFFGGIIHYIPIFVEETTTYIRICIDVTTSGAGNVDLRIFNWSSGVPGSLVLSAGTVDVSSTGVKEITISQELTRGYYFLAYRSDVEVTLNGIDYSYSTSLPVSGIATSTGYLSNLIVLIVTAAYNDPAPAPTGAKHIRYASVFMREN